MERDRATGFAATFNNRESTDIDFTAGVSCVVGNGFEAVRNFCLKVLNIPQKKGQVSRNAEIQSARYLSEFHSPCSI